jgi:hypothetical protein
MSVGGSLRGLWSSQLNRDPKTRHVDSLGSSTVVRMSTPKFELDFGPSAKDCRADYTIGIDLVRSDSTTKPKKPMATLVVIVATAATTARADVRIAMGVLNLL